jgi:Flp pilus assembly protein TadG
MRTPDSPSISGFASVNREVRFPNGLAAPGLRRLKGEDGNSLLEYAFIAMLFMIMLLGIIDFGRALYAYHFASHAAREATRWAAVNGYTCGPGTTAGTPFDSSCNGTAPMNNGPASATDIQNYVKSLVPSSLDSSKVTTTPNWPVPATKPTACTANPTAPSCLCYTTATQNYPGCTVEVQVTYAFSFNYPFIHNGSINLSSTSEMVIVH